LVFPVIASFYWDKVSNTAFTVSVFAGLAVFFPVRFAWIELTGATALVSEVFAALGVGVIAGLMGFGFFGQRAGIVIGAVVAAIALPLGIGFLHAYPVLTASLLAYAVSTIVCTGISLVNQERFD